MDISDGFRGIPEGRGVLSVTRPKFCENCKMKENWTDSMAPVSSVFRKLPTLSILPYRSGTVNSKSFVGKVFL